MANGTVSVRGLAFIGRWEGFSPTLYNDPLGHCTIGYGHLVHRGRCTGSEPAEFRTGISPARGLALLRGDSGTAVRAVNAGVRVPMTQHKFDALVSFTFNIGASAFQSSTLLRIVNQGRHGEVPAELNQWTDGGLEGLVRRRTAEGILYVSGQY
ncbi:Phage-related lysozyme (muramidase), GH24 family [Microbacterium sp. cf046]|uniref:lysozyme n=1 Tax=Microbacterium sp. cf046 TaxID=1761803 RepID=UPI0008ECE702|nr:Phage-related lysozyme (muramidase), GH24 family [Microbacterium sp. cf046]